jgi:MFS transporter, DHA1 family, multidrug resistance protein B
VLIAHLHRNVKLRLGVGFVIRFLSFMLAPLMVIRFAAIYGTATAGLLLFVSTCAAIASTILGGHLSDSRGRRPVLLISDGGIMAGYVLMAVANSSLLHASATAAGIGTYAGFMIITVMGGLAFPVTDAMLIDVVTMETRRTIYTLDYWSLNLAFSCGAIVGTFLYAHHFRLLLLGAAVLSGAVFTVTFLFLTETRPENPRGEPSPKGPRALLAGYRMVWRDPLFARILLAATLIRSVEAQITYYIAVRLATRVPEQHLIHLGSWTFSASGVQMLGLVRTLNTVMVVCLALLVRRLLKGVSDRLRLTLGIGLYTAGFMVLAVSTVGWVLIGAAVVYTIGELLSAPIRQLLVSDFAMPEGRSRYMAAYSMQVRIGLLVASLCVSLGTLVSPVGMAVLYGVLGGSSLLVYSTLFRHRAGRLPAGPGAAGAQQATSAAAEPAPAAAGLAAEPAAGPAAEPKGAGT